MMEVANAAPKTKNPFGVNLDCIHCGICLSVCPTYLAVRNEADSPRGRIVLMQAADAGKIPFDDTLAHHLYFCVGCRACETACPSGVRFEHLLNESRQEIERHRRRPVLQRWLRHVVFRKLLPSQRLLHVVCTALRLYQRLGLQRLVRRSQLLKSWAPALMNAESLLPSIPRMTPLPDSKSAEGDARFRVALVRGCVMNEMFSPIQHATLEVLSALGCEVEVPPRQTCCGALHLHSGELEFMREMAARNLDAFDLDRYDFIIINSAGCGAALKEYGELLAGTAHAERANHFAAMVLDVMEFVDRYGAGAPMRPIPRRVTYDDPCHLIHGQKVSEEPRRVLSRIPQLQLVELQDSDKCCGSAGIYNITQHDFSMELLEEKIDNIRKTGAELVITGNPGCLMQIRYGLKRHSMDVQACHPVELVREALCGYWIHG